MASSIKITPKKFLIRILLFTFLAFLVIRLVCFIFRFGFESLQMDFSAFYTAGESFNHGLSPYENHINYNPPIWDGRCIFKHSRFLYPPLFGVLFRPLALIPYLYAKFFWMFFTIFCIIFSLSIVNKIIKAENNIESILVIYIFLCLFYPLLTLLERGHVYGVTLLVMIVAIKLMLKDAKSEFLSGICWSIATLLQLYSAFIFPFLILRRKWKVMAGYIVGIVAILILTIILTGPKLMPEYIFNEMPRIIAFSEGGTNGMLLPPETIQKPLQYILRGMTVKDGIIYRLESFSFVSNATLVRTFFGEFVSKVLIKIGIKVNTAILSIAILGIFFIIMSCWQFYHRKDFSRLTAIQEVIYWQIVLIIVLLSGPLIWVMNVIWILPSLIIILEGYRLMANKLQAIYLYLGIISLIIAALPDLYSFPFLLPYADNFFAYKYIFAEVLLFLSLLCLLNNSFKYNKDF